MTRYENIYNELMEQIKKEPNPEIVNDKDLVDKTYRLKNLVDKTYLEKDQEYMFNIKFVNLIQKNEIILLDNIECTVISVLVSNQINNRQFLILAINNNGEKVEKLFKTGDRVYAIK